MKALEKFREITKTLLSSGIESASKEAELLVRHALNISLEKIYRDDPEITVEQDRVISEMLGRRAGREPLQYILGEVDFLTLKIKVGQGVLIPRPETELMAEHAVKTVNSKQSTVSSEERTRVLDLCCGSGCLGLALAKEFPDAEVCGLDISEHALLYADENAKFNNIKNIKFFKGHLFDALEKDLVFDLIISNPPYIRSADVQGLQVEIKDWEPLNALDGGIEGLDLYREIISSAGRFLNDDGILMFELGMGCSEGVREMFEQAGYRDIHIIKDYAGIERIIQAVWTK